MIRRICICTCTKSRELKSEYWCFVMSIVVANRNDNNLNLGNYWVRNVSLNSTYFHFNNYVNGCKRLSYLLSYNDIRIDKMIVFNILLIKITICFSQGLSIVLTRNSHYSNYYNNNTQLAMPIEYFNLSTSHWFGLIIPHFRNNLSNL